MFFDWWVPLLHINVLLEGALLTIWITIVVFFLSAFFGMIFAVMRYYKSSKITYAISTCYVELIRNTPLLVQIFLIYFGLPQFGIRLSPILAGILGLTINTTAYYAEIFRAGIQSVSRGQWEAAQSIGISDFATFKIIILPQGLKNIWPSLTNQFIMIIFGTSLLSVLDVRELTQQASILISTTLRTLEIYVFVILMYYVMTIAFSALLNVVNHKLFPAIK